MTPQDYNSSMAFVRGVLAAERNKFVIRWAFTLFYVYLLAEVIWFMGHGWQSTSNPMSLHVGTPVLACVLIARIFGRISRGF